MTAAEQMIRSAVRTVLNEAKSGAEWSAVPWDEVKAEELLPEVTAEFLEEQQLGLYRVETPKGTRYEFFYSPPSEGGRIIGSSSVSQAADDVLDEIQGQLADARRVLDAFRVDERNARARANP